jgi:hypothetical protein
VKASEKERVTPTTMPLEERQRRFAQDVRRWIAVECVVSSRCAASKPRMLHREFSSWSRLECSEEVFVAELQKYGLGLDEAGCVTGLALRIDFEMACAYEATPSNLNNANEEGP